MKAVQFAHFGERDVLEYIDVATPKPKNDDLLDRGHRGWRKLRGHTRTNGDIWPRRDPRRPHRSTPHIGRVALCAGSGDGGVHGFGLRAGLGSDFVVFALGLRDRGGHVIGLAGRRDQVDGPVAEGLKIFVPVGEA